MTTAAATEKPMNDESMSGTEFYARHWLNLKRQRLVDVALSWFFRRLKQVGEAVRLGRLRVRHDLATTRAVREALAVAAAGDLGTWAAIAEWPLRSFYILEERLSGQLYGVGSLPGKYFGPVDRDRHSKSRKALEQQDNQNRCK